MDFAALADHVRDTTEFEFPFFTYHLPKVLGFQLTRFMVLEAIAALAMLLIFIPLARGFARAARRAASSRTCSRRCWSSFATRLPGLRSAATTPTVPPVPVEHLLLHPVLQPAGIVPWMVSPTGALTVTTGLAALTFCAVVGTGMMKFGRVAI